MITTSLKSIVLDLKKTLSTHSPEILTGIGIAGMITTTVLAVRATPKALIQIEEKKNELDADTLTTKETVLATWKCYIPSAIIGSVSVGCLIGANSVNIRRRAALATAYSLSESALREYREKVVETIGEKKEQAVRDAVAKDRVDKKPVNDREVIITEKGNTLCLDYVSGRHFRSDIDTIKKAVNELNRRMRDEMWISLNDFYYEIGLPLNGIGDDIGWNIDNGYIEPNFSSQLTKDGTPCLVIDYLVEPRYDFRTA